MKNKIKRLFILIISILFTLNLCSCFLIKDTKENNHTFSSEWTNDSEYHWHNCLESGCNEIGSKEEHDFVETIITEATCHSVGSKVLKCSKCGYVKENSTTSIPTTSHSYTVITYTWSNDNSSCTAKAKCAYCDASVTETKNSTSEVTQERSCTKDEISKYTVTFLNNNGKGVTFATQTKTNVKTNNKLDHSYTVISYTWNSDFTKCTAKAKCSTCTEYISETVDAVKNVVQEQTCTNDELSNLTATFLNNNGKGVTFVAQIKTNYKTKDKLGHSYSSITYNWSDDNSSCTAKAVCANCSSEITETKSSTSDISQYSSCEKDELTKYSVSFTNSLFTAQSKEIKTGNKTNHNYVFTEFIWANDYTAKAVYTCSGCEGTEEHDADVVLENVSGKCTDKGTTTVKYIASYEGHEDSKTNSFASYSSHTTYVFKEYVWNSDYTECRYITYCTHCGNTNTKATAKSTNSTDKSNVRSETVSEATCTDTGIVKYISTFYYSGNIIGTTYIQVDTEVDPNSHNYGTWISGVEATQTTDGTKGHYHCSLCNKNFDSEYQELSSIVVKYNELDTVETSVNLFASDTLDYIPTYKTTYNINPIQYSTITCTTTFNINTIYDGYYKNGLSWTNQADLRRKLNELITSNYNKLDYNWESNTYADQSLYVSEFLDVVYSSSDVYASRTGVGWQREHAWCASLMTGELTSEAVKTKGRATDFHNLFAAYASGNTSRGNKSFGNAETNVTTVKDNNVVQYEYDANAFEPSDNDKGRLARAIFYMAIMYMDRTWLNDLEGKTYNTIDGLPGLEIVNGALPTYNSNDSNTFYKMGHFEDLIEWALYSVDRVEFQHNEMVYGHKNNGKTAQGNRNPFVDFPELVKYAFDPDYENVGGTLTDLVPSYNYLFLNSSDVYCYQISCDNYQIDETEAITKNDFIVYAISNYTGDFTTSIYKHEVVTNYTLSNLNASNKFDEAGNNDLVFTFDDTLKTTLDLLYVTRKLQESSFSADLTTTVFKDYTNGDNNLTINGTSWIFNCKENANSTANVLQSNALGSRIGSSGNPVNQITLTSKYNFNCDELNLINAIYIKGSTASGNTYNIKITVKDSTGNVLKTTGDLNLSYTNAEIPELISLENIGGVKGIIEISITGITSALYLHSIGVDLS